MVRSHEREIATLATTLPQGIRILVRFKLVSFVLQLGPFRHRSDSDDTFSTRRAIMPQEFQDQLIEFLPKMRVWALALTRNRAAAEDLTQDVATKALVAKDCFTPGTNFSAWVHRIMVNHFISGVRSRREYTDVDTVPELPVPAAHEDRTALRELGWALDRLPRDQREAISMIVLQEQSYEDAAEVTGCAIGTLKSRVHRARLQLRAYLTGEQTAQAA
jgi:RNA polymerase sigma-70 factor, ECF subfamily